MVNWSYGPCESEIMPSSCRASYPPVRNGFHHACFYFLVGLHITSESWLVLRLSSYRVGSWFDGFFFRTVVSSTNFVGKPPNTDLVCSRVALKSAGRPDHTISSHTDVGRCGNIWNSPNNRSSSQAARAHHPRRAQSRTGRFLRVLLIPKFYLKKCLHDQRKVR